MRQKSAVRDLVSAVMFVVGIYVFAASIQNLWKDPGEYVSGGPPFMSRWLVTASALAVLILPLVAAALGALAVPGSEEFELTQTALITRLQPIDLVLGRLVAGIWPLISAVLLSLVTCLGVQLVAHPISGPDHGYGHIFTAHAVILTAVLLAAALGFVAAEGRRPGRSPGRGAAVGIGCFAVALLAIWLVDPLWGHMRHPAPAIEAVLLVNPVVAATTAYGSYDPIRAPVVYDHLTAHDYEFHYPPSAATAGLYALLAAGGCAAAAFRLRRAYR
jgi:hypothetical protein